MSSPEYYSLVFWRKYAVKFEKEFTKTAVYFMLFWKCIIVHICLSYQLNAHCLYSITIYMLHYNPQHVSSSTLLIFRRTNFIITASGIVTLCKRPYSMLVESGLQSALNRHTVRPFTESDDTRCCDNSLSSWRWAMYCSKHVEDYNVTYILL